MPAASICASICSSVTDLMSSAERPIFLVWNSRVHAGRALADDAGRQWIDDNIDRASCHAGSPLAARIMR